MSPSVTLLGKREENLPTAETRADDFPESWVDLRWIRTPDGNPEYRDRMGYFRIYTTALDGDGTPCKGMVTAHFLKIPIPGDGIAELSAKPVYDGPYVASCDGRIQVTSLAHLEGE